MILLENVTGLLEREGAIAAIREGTGAKAPKYFDKSRLLRRSRVFRRRESNGGL
jgi:hypothetical protein